MMITSFQELLGVLQADGVLHRADLAEQAVQIPTQRGDIDAFMIVRWQPNDGIVQFIQPLPVAITPETLPALAEAVTRLNHGLAIPGFDLNYTHLILSFRLYLTIYPRGAVHADEVRALFRLTLQNAADFMPLFRAVLGGELAPAHVVEAAQRLRG